MYGSRFKVQSLRFFHFGVQRYIFFIFTQRRKGAKKKLCAFAPLREKH